MSIILSRCSFKGCLFLWAKGFTPSRKFGGQANEDEIKQKMVHQCSYFVLTSQKTFEYVYFDETDAFEEMKGFFSDFVAKEEIKWHTKTRDMKKELSDLVKGSNMKAIVMGSRRNDPYCGSNH